MENSHHSSRHGDDNRIGVGASRADEIEESTEDNEVLNSAVADSANAPGSDLPRVEMSEVPEAARKWYQRRLFWLISIVSCILLAVAIAIAVVLTRPPTPVTPEQTACNFLSLTNLIECRQSTGGAYTPVTDAGTIPSEIGLLTQLTELSFYYGFQGSIPSEIGLLTRLTDLTFLGTDVTGTIPKEVGRLSRLGGFSIKRNRLLTGIIPTEIGLLTRLSVLEFSFNELVAGKIPSEIGLLTQTYSMELNFNQLSGMIPSEIGLMTRLSAFEAKFNRLAGRMPSEIGLLTQLYSLKLSSNQLTGRIPSEIRSLHPRDYTINYFWTNNWYIFGNQLTGAIPPSLCSRKGYIVVDCGEVNCTNCRICHCVRWNGTNF